MLNIESDDQDFIDEVQRAIIALTGPNAFTFRATSSCMSGTTGANVLRGVQLALNAARLNHPVGVELVDRLVSHPRHTVRITRTAGMGGGARPERGFWTALYTDAALMRLATTPGEGANVLITWVPVDLETANMGPLRRVQNENCPKHIILAHEMVHADHITRGRFLSGIGNTVNVVDGVTNKTYGSMVFLDDIYNIGLTDTDNAVPADVDRITENDIRQEQGVNPRALYGLYNARVTVRERRASVSHHDHDVLAIDLPLLDKRRLSF